MTLEKYSANCRREWRPPASHSNLISMVLRTLHPTIAATIYIWRADGVDVEVVPRTNAIVRSKAYEKSLIKRIADGAPGIRRRLAGRDCPRDFPILDDLAKEGVTD